MIRVPLLVEPGTQAKKFVEIREESLPENVDKLIQMLSKEKVSIEYWLEVSACLQLMYYRTGQLKKFSSILSEALREESFEAIHKSHMVENEKERVQVMNVLASHQLNLAETENDPAQQKVHRTKGHQLIEQANTISQINPNNLISMCFYQITRGQLKQAQQYCEQSKSQLKIKASAVKYSKAQSTSSNSDVKALYMLTKAIIDFNKG